MQGGALPNTYGWRDESVTAGRVIELAEDAGLRCVGQELISWTYGRYLIDCISIFTPAGSRRVRDLVRVENRDFMREAAGVERRARVFS